MAISDYIWPFERKFSKIPCAREASIIALLGGPAIGALVIILKRRPILAFKTTLYSSTAILWVAFGICRVQDVRMKFNSEEFTDAVATGRID